MKLTIWLFLLLTTFLHASNGVDPPDNKDLENDDKLHVKNFAESALEKIYNRRHAALFQQIENLNHEKLENIKEKITQEYGHLIGFENVVAKIKNTDTSKMKDTLTHEVEMDKNLNTVAALFSEKGKYLAVAANIQTLDIPDLENVDLWFSLLAKTNWEGKAFDLPNLLKKYEKQYIFRHKDFGLNDGDTVSILEALKDNKKIDQNEIKIFTLEPEFAIEGKLQEVDKAIKDLENEIGKLKRKQMSDKVNFDQKDKSDLKNQQTKLQGLKDKKKKYTEVQNKIDRVKDLKTQIEELSGKETGSKTVDVDKLVVKFSQTKTELNRAPHAEIQLLKLKDEKSVFNYGEGSILVVAPSKPACVNCEAELTTEEVKKFIVFPQGDEYYPGKKSNKNVKNWENNIKVATTEISPNTKESDSKKESLPGECEAGKSKKKRSLSEEGCVFFVARENDPVMGKRKTSIQEIRSEEFLKTYAESDSKTRKIIGDAVSGNADKVVGSEENVAKVKTVVEYEKLQKTKYSVDYSSEVLKSGNFFESKSKGPFTSEELLSRITLSPSQTSKALYGKSAQFPSEPEKLSGAIGTFILAKTVVTAINRGDTQTLEIVGGRVGGEAALHAIGHYGSETALKLGTKLEIEATAKVASKALRFLGKAAGPLGAATDIGLSVWGLSNSVKRLKEPGATKFQQNEAIADIVENSVNIAITATLTVASFIFPPLAPVFAVVGFFSSLIIDEATSLYKAANHVESLNSQIKLLNYEKVEEFGRYAESEDTSSYLKNLIKVKTANNLLVNATVEYLEKDLNVIGEVLPSRSFSVKGSCRYLKKMCISLIVQLDCTPGEVVAESCWSEGGDCDDFAGKCESKKENIDFLGTTYYTYECQCQGEPKTTFGVEEVNSLVDFRMKQRIYLERSVPDPPIKYEYEFLCLPSSLTFKGDKISKRNEEFGYNCENAMAVKRKSENGKFMLYKLGAGDDQVKLNIADKTNNLFLVDDGNKEYHGSAGIDTFSITGNCSKLEGYIDGRPFGDDNVLDLGEKCASAKILTVDLENNLMTSEESVKLFILNIPIVYGRSGEMDVILASCRTKFIDGRGGKLPLFPDIIKVNDLKCVMNLTIMARNLTTINLGHSEGHVGVWVPRGEKTIDFQHTAVSSISITSYLFRTSCFFLTTVSVKKGSNDITQIMVSFAAGQSASLSFPSDSDLFPAILLDEDQHDQEGLTSSIIFDANLTPRVVHALETNDQNQRTRRGTGVVSNYFNCVEGNWILIGGKFNDDFVLTGNLFMGIINGGDGVDSLYLDNNLDASVITVSETNIETNIWMSNIDRIFGRTNRTDHIICGSETSYVAAGGGRSNDDPDVVTIIGSKYDKENSELTVVATGSTKVISNMTQGQLVVVVPAEKYFALSITLFISQNSKIIVYAKYPASSIQTVTSDCHSNVCQMIIQLGEGQSIAVDVTEGDIWEESDQDNLLQPVIAFEESDGSTIRILVNRLSGSLTAFHQLHSVGGKLLERTGSSLLPNYFQLQSGNWRVIGQNGNDVFDVLYPLNARIEGGDGINSLYLGAGITDEVLSIDGLLGEVTFGGKSKVTFNGVQKIYGRKNRVDNFVGSCQTTFVSLNGGSLRVPDLIELRELVDCTSTIQIMCSGHTKIKSYENAVDFEAHILKGGNGNINFEATFHTAGKRLLVLYVDIDDLLDLNSYTRMINNKTHYTFDLKLAGNEETNRVFLDFIAEDSHASSPYLPSPQVTILGRNNVIKGKLLIRSSDAQGVVMHVLASKSKKYTRNGAKLISNFFDLISGLWNVIGGRVDDVFFLNGDNFTGFINGYIGTNTLVISENITAEFISVDLHNENIKILSRHISVKKIQNFQGRSDKLDFISCSCDTQYVNGQGGPNSTIMDYILVLDCPQSVPLTIVMARNTQVQNLRSGGYVTYVILQDDSFDITETNPENVKRLYQFKVHTNRIRDVQFQRNNKSLTLKFVSNKVLNLALTDVNEESKEIRNPVVQFKETEAIVADIRVRNTGTVYSSITVKKGVDDGMPVYGIRSVDNEILINVGDNEPLVAVYGRKKDDTFWLESAGFIEVLDGSKGTNTLVLLPQLYPDNPLLVDLRENSGEIRLSNETTLIKHLKNVQIVRGRPNAFEVVLASCQTKYLSSADDISFTNYNCSTYNVFIEVSRNTEVSFSGNLNNYESVYAGGTFYYKFETLRSFDPDFDFWFTIRNTVQVYYLKFTITDLESITFSKKESKLRYVVSNVTYGHSVDPYLELDQNFYAQPKLVSSDGFHIQITRHGHIYLTLVQNVSKEEIQTDLVFKYGALANKLNVTVIVQTPKDFVYISNRADRGSNVLSNTDKRSHLVGGGGSNVNYHVLDLVADVFIYSGLDKGDGNEIQLVDMTEVIWKIRNETSTKYLPHIRETAEGHLEVSIDEFNSTYSGKVIIMDGVKRAQQLQFLFNAVVMKLEPLDRTKRSIAEDKVGLRKLQPLPIVVVEDTVSVLTAEDFEYGQEIVMSHGNTSLHDKRFQFLRKDNDLILTNLGIRKTIKSGISSLMFFDFYNKDVPLTLHSLQDLKIKIGKQVVKMNFDESRQLNSTEVGDFYEFLERVEETLLEGLPEIGRQFQTNKRA